MCTLGLLLGVSPRFPLIVAANRDEQLGRPSTAPQLWLTPRLVAGRDLRAGGTWLGVNAQGLVAGLTNLWTSRPADPSLASRGQFVLGLLAQPDLAAAQRWATAQDATRSNPFLAVCADRSGRAFWVQAQQELAVHPLEPGVHAFGNTRPQLFAAKPDAAARAFAAAFAARSGDSPEEILAALSPALAAHSASRGPLDSVCVHGESGYGTVSSSCILLGASLGAYYHAPGPPCTTSFRPHSALLAQLLTN